MEKELINKTQHQSIKFTLFNFEGKSRESAKKIRCEFLAEFENGISNFLIDLTKLEMINSSLIGVLAFMSSTIQSMGKILIYTPNREITKHLEVLKIFNLPNVFLIFKPK